VARLLAFSAEVVAATGVIEAIVVVAVVVVSTVHWTVWAME
jgi:hypothetical protein